MTRSLAEVCRRESSLALTRPITVFVLGEGGGLGEGMLGKARVPDTFQLSPGRTTKRVPNVPRMERSWRPKLTAYRLGLAVVTLALSTAKALCSPRVASVMLEWIGGVVFFIPWVSHPRHALEVVGSQAEILNRQSLLPLVPRRGQ
jgi:hypothetical protein